MIYKKLSKCEDISTDLLRFYVNTYLNCSLEESTHLNRTELVVKVKEAELLRRPNRPKFTVVLGLGEGAQFWDLFNTTNITNSSVTTVSSVQTKKLFKEEVKFPYRTIIVGPNFLNSFVYGKLKSTAVYLETLLGFHPADEFRLFIPPYFLNYLKPSAEKGHFEKFDDNLISELNVNMSENQDDTADKKVNTPGLITQQSSTSQPNISPVQNVTGQPTFIPGVPGFYGSKEVNLANTWDPDNQEGCNVEDAVALLKFCKNINMYRTDAVLIMSFLSENKQLNLLSVLTNDQLNDLDSFISWLSLYNRADKNYFNDLFKNTKQGNLSFMSYFLKLKSLYLKSKGKITADQLNESDKEVISRAYIKNLVDPQVKQALLTQPEISTAFDCGLKGLVEKSNFFKQRFAECSPETANNSVNLTINNEFAELSKKFDGLALFMSDKNNVGQKDDKKVRFDTRKCWTCGKSGHISNECRSNAKGRRGNYNQNSERRGRSDHRNRDYSRNRDQSRDRNRDYSRNRDQSRDRNRDHSNNNRRGSDRHIDGPVNRGYDRKYDQSYRNRSHSRNDNRDYNRNYRDHSGNRPNQYSGYRSNSNYRQSSRDRDNNVHWRDRSQSRDRGYNNYRNDRNHSHDRHQAKN